MKKIKILLFFLFISLIIYGQPDGPLSPASNGIDMTVGSLTWSNGGNIYASDNSRARIDLDNAGDVSYYLTATNFGFAIPSGSIIDGIVVAIEVSDNGGGGAIRDNSVKIIKGGTVSGTDQSIAGAWASSDTYKTYGSSTNLWGVAWTETDINSATFGVAISARRTGGGGNNRARVDHIRITVYYTLDPLPIELLYFTGSNKGNTINLEWATASEFNNDYFAILKCKDGKSWIEIGRVQGSGNSSMQIHYEYTDIEPSEGYNYFLLKQIDFNGQYEYFKIIAIKHSFYAQYTPRYNILGQYTK